MSPVVEAVDEYEPGCRRTTESAGAHRSTSRRGQPTHREQGTGLIHIEMFATLDLVGQAPGGPDEDPEGGFPFGGWQAPLMDDVEGAQVMAAYEGTDAL